MPPWVGARNAVLSLRLQDVWVPKLQLVQEPAADALLDNNPFALLVGMVLDHQ